jgi:hypothetical protein
VLKYYSLKSNVELHDKLQVREIRLREQREEIFRKKLEYQEHVHEVRANIKDYFELQKSIVSEYCRLLLNIRSKANSSNNRNFVQPIIEEPSN